MPAHASIPPGATPLRVRDPPDGTLVVTEAFRAEKGAAASSYRVDGDAIVPVTATSAGRSEICWAVLFDEGRYAFIRRTSPTARVSRYAIARDGSLTLEDAVAGLTIDGQPGLRDEDLSDDGAYLYAIDADQGRIVGWSVGADGQLSMLGSWDGVPTTVAGLAAR